jgi:hypothetical protein
MQDALNEEQQQQLSSFTPLTALFLQPLAAVAFLDIDLGINNRLQLSTSVDSPLATITILGVCLGRWPQL